ncbi:MAG: VCBS repeat-containing protein [Bacillota bacterium]
MKKTALIVLCFIIYHIVSAAGTQAKGNYDFFWEADVRGYGGYRYWTADLDGDGVLELVVQAMQGEWEGGEKPPVRTVIYKRLTPVYDATDEEILSVLDIDQDGKFEIVTVDGVYALRAGRLVKLDNGQELLDEYLKLGYINTSAEEMRGFEHLVDLDGDGYMELVRHGEGNMLSICSKTYEDVNLEVPMHGAWPDIEAYFPVIDGKRAIFVVSQAKSGGDALEWRLYKLDGGSWNLDFMQEVRGDRVYTFFDLDGDGSEELVTSSRGIIRVYRLEDRKWEMVWESPDNGGMGFVSFVLGDFNGNGRTELVARHVFPGLYNHNLKIYEWVDERFVGIADVASVGWHVGPWPAAGDFLGLGRDQIIMCTEFEMARPRGFGYAVPSDAIGWEPVMEGPSSGNGPAEADPPTVGGNGDRTEAATARILRMLAAGLAALGTGIGGLILFRKLKP